MFCRAARNDLKRTVDCSAAHVDAVESMLVWRSYDAGVTAKDNGIDRKTGSRVLSRQFQIEINIVITGLNRNEHTSRCCANCRK